MSCVILILVAAVGCNAEMFRVSTVELPLKQNHRIIDGSNTTIEQFPYVVQVLFYNMTLCGGTLLTRRHVLSAAHCFVDTIGTVAVKVSPHLYSIRLGTRFANSGGSVHQVSDITVHESFNDPLLDNDVAVVFMSSAATLSATVAKASIPVQGAIVPDNNTVIAVGWGQTRFKARSEVLNQVEIMIVPWEICYAQYRYLQMLIKLPQPITENMICAGIVDVGGKSTCKGDSGGPLIYNGVVVGITSWSYSCAMPDYPGVFARVSSYTNWINDTVMQFNAKSLGSRQEAITLLAPLLYLIFNV